MAAEDTGRHPEMEATADSTLLAGATSAEGQFSYPICSHCSLTGLVTLDSHTPSP